MKPYVGTKLTGSNSIWWYSVTCEASWSRQVDHILIFAITVLTSWVIVCVKLFVLTTYVTNVCKAHT